MRSSLLHQSLLVAVLLGCLNAAPAQSLLLHYDFNVPPNTSDEEIITDRSNGGHDGILYLGGLTTTRPLGDETGVSGKNGDFAVTFSTGDTFRAESGHSVLQTLGPNAQFPSLESFTISGWFSASRALRPADKILQTTGTAGIAVLQVNDDADIEFTIDEKIMVRSTGDQFNQVGEWTFFALTYDSVSHEVKLWRGSKENKVAVVASSPSALSPWEYKVDSTGGMYWGNSTTMSNSREFGGTLDDLRIYGATTGASGALTEKQLDEVRVSGLAGAGTGK